MTTVLRPETPAQVAEAVAWAAADEAPLELVGAATKRGLGRPVQAGHTLDLSALYGITLYEPEELVLSAGAGTPLAEIETALAGKQQQLAFEPPDLGPLFGAPAGKGTIGGALACNLSGPRRIKAGGARDHFLGFKAVSGRGEAFKAGSRVVKNVTGYDLCKLLAGSYGTLVALTDVTIKVLPAPEKTRTLLLVGLADAVAVRAMSRALQSSHEVSGAAHLPAALAAALPVELVARAGDAVTAIRVEGPGPSVEFRCAALRRELADLGAATEELHSHNSALFWRGLRDVAPFVADRQTAVWRLSVPPMAGAQVVTTLVAALDVLGKSQYFYDWGGGLIWFALPATADAAAETVRGAIAACGGHATLVRAPDETRVAVPVFQPQPEPLALLSRRVKESFDPRRILNPGRLSAAI
ncbi:glycolate oxidase subunit GlcE [Rhodospirillaceae bacterium SYSU D60014]|uniref:glycolate oxidase subunit GlcE n=1 Tax=Virgifigura deserti TaxID=2268457 RepID=UPI000E666D52